MPENMFEKHTQYVRLVSFESLDVDKNEQICRSQFKTKLLKSYLTSLVNSPV